MITSDLFLPNARVHAAIIDLDGTMVDTGPDFQHAINAMRAEFDLAPLDLPSITALVGKGSENLVRGVLQLDLDAAAVERQFAAALESYQSHYEEINGHYAKLYPQVLEALQELREQGIKLACVTNKPQGFARSLLAQFGLLPYFALLYGGDSWPRKKPDPFPLLQVCENFVLSPASVLVLGDSSNDAQAARAAKCPVWILPYGYNHGESVHKIDCDGIVSTLYLAARQIAVHNLRQP